MNIFKLNVTDIILYYVVNIVFHLLHCSAIKIIRCLKLVTNADYQRNIYNHIY